MGGQREENWDAGSPSAPFPVLTQPVQNVSVRSGLFLFDALHLQGSVLAQLTLVPGSGTGAGAGRRARELMVKPEVVFYRMAISL